MAKGGGGSMEIKQGDVFYADFGKILNDSVQGGVRPCVVVSNNVHNSYADLIICVPTTTKTKKQLPVHAKVMLDSESIALCEQLTTLSRKKFISKIGTLTTQEMNEVIFRVYIQLEIIPHYAKIEDYVFGTYSREELDAIYSKYGTINDFIATEQFFINDDTDYSDWINDNKQEVVNE